MDFITEFKSQWSHITTPRYLEWVGLSTLSATSNRGSFTSIKTGLPLYPNLYVLLIGEAGLGKTLALNAGKNLLRGFDNDAGGNITMAPDSTTYEKLVNLLAEQTSLAVKAGYGSSVATCACFLSEWGTFIRKPNSDVFSMLAHLYDCGDYDHDVLGRARDLAKNLFVNICACATPAWFAEGFPSNSWEQGLPTRINYIWSDRSELPTGAEDVDWMEDYDDEYDFGDTVDDRLFKHLIKVQDSKGFWKWTAPAFKELRDWLTDGAEPKPEDPMLDGYCNRRRLHVSKLAMLYGMSRHPTERQIDLIDFDRAKATLLESEVHMMKCLTAAGGNTYQIRAQTIIDYVTFKWTTEKKGISEWELRQILWKQVDPHLVRTILDELIASKKIVLWGNKQAKSPLRMFKPGREVGV